MLILSMPSPIRTNGDIRLICKFLDSLRYTTDLGGTVAHFLEIVFFE